MGGQALSAPSSYQCFVFHIIVKGILSTRFFSLRIPFTRYYDSSGQRAAHPVWISEKKNSPYPAIIIHESKVSGQKRTFIGAHSCTVDRNTKISLENPS
jgi:hypothetical protein